MVGLTVVALTITTLAVAAAAARISQPRRALERLIGELPASVQGVRYATDAVGLLGNMGEHTTFYRFSIEEDDMNALAERLDLRRAGRFLRPVGAPRWWRYTAGAEGFAWSGTGRWQSARGMWSPDGTVVIVVDWLGI